MQALEMLNICMGHAASQTKIEAVVILANQADQKSSSEQSPGAPLHGKAEGKGWLVLPYSLDHEPGGSARRAWPPLTTQGYFPICLFLCPARKGNSSWEHSTAGAEL